MKIKSISKSKRPVFKNNGDLMIGESVITPLGRKIITTIHDQGIREVFRITLSNKKSFRVDSDHLNTISFREINGEQLWENATTSWLVNNKERFVFSFPSKEDVLGFSTESSMRVSTEFNNPDLSEKFSIGIKSDLYIESIEKVENENTKCITLEYTLGLFYTGDYIITHNSFASTVSSLYITTHLWSMRDPKKFFGLSQAASIVHGMISFTISKAQQLLLQPFYQILLSSPKFQRIRQEEKLIIKQEEEYPDKICWTSSGKMGALQFYGDVHYIIASSPAQLLGLNMISAVLSEISFFIEQGYSADYIWRIYNDSKGRIQSRFGTRYFATTILDSSPNDMEASPIDKYIFTGKAAEDKRNYIVTGAHWEHLPWKYPIWEKTQETFPVFKGSASEPPEMLSLLDLKKYTADDIYNVPIDIKQLFIDDLTKSVKDYCGWPSGTQNKLVRDYNVIEDCFSESLRNFYTFIYAPADKSPELLIWNQVVDKFFIHHGNGRYEFYRSPHEIRFMHVDQSESGDFTGISMVHPELNIDGETIYITDFTIAINPGKHRINLDAIRLFIVDLKKKGGIKYGLITFDQYQSSSAIQYLKNKGFPCERLSVDRDPNPYLVAISLLNNRRIKSGRNLLLKNNIKSLQEVRTATGKKKIDHLKGKIDKDLATNDWTTSTIGFYAKDLSDAWVGAIWNAIHNYTLVPRYIYKEKKAGQTTEEARNETKQKLIDKVRKTYGLAAMTPGTHL